MPSGSKQKQRRRKRRSSARNNYRTNSSHAVASSDFPRIVSSLTDLEWVRKRRRARRTKQKKKKQSNPKNLSGGRGYTPPHEITMPDETPVTAGKCRGKKAGYKKFRDNKERRLKLRKNRLNRNSKDLQIQSISQRVTKKLLRAIRIRQLNNLNRTKQLQRISNLNRQLNLPNHSNHSSNVSNSTLEEGEIISDNEVTDALTIDNGIDDDDDCVCIEPQTEQIVIDDEEPDTSHSTMKNKKNNYTSAGYVSLIQRMYERSTALTSKLVTSTPHVATARNSTRNANDSCGVLSTMFFEDISGGNTPRNPNSKRRIRRPKKSKNRITDPEDVIILDDTVKDSAFKIAGRTASNTNMDDSVIFISKTVAKSDKPATAPDFVPLQSDDVPNPIIVPESPPRGPRRAAIHSELFTNSEKKQLTAYNNNTYNPNAGDPQAKEKLSTKRLILIDACNVAFNHALNKEFSVKGLKICIDYFEKMGHEVKAVVPQFRLHKCSDPTAMFQLHSAGKIVVTPCKNLPGKVTISYDDRFILQLAAEMDAVIVSNDNYRDLINENAAFKKLIENRVIGFTWCNDLFMVAKDPYGKWGPCLLTILNRV